MRFNGIKNMKKALIIEDDRDMAHIVGLHLQRQGYTPKYTRLAREGLALGKSREFQLIVLDLMLPDGDGMEVCKQLRKEQLPTHIIMLTAKSDEIDVVLGLELGADDYIAKPFRGRELEARIKAVARRGFQLESPFPEIETKPLVRADLAIDRVGRTVRVSGQSVELTPKEFDLLVLLASHPGRAFSRSQLIDLVWGYQYQGFEHTVNSLVNRLRSKIEPNPSQPHYISTVWGLGYKFNEALKGVG